MKKFMLMISAVVLIGSTSTIYADTLPYFGAEPIRGSYWNGPEADYPYPARSGYKGWGYSGRGYDSYAQANCRYVRTRRVAADGTVFYRRHRWCS